MSGDKDQTCCLIENGERCKKQSGNASFNFRVQKLVEQRKLKFSLDSNVSTTNLLVTLHNGRKSSCGLFVFVFLFFSKSMIM